jgi:hypothetical protein
MPGRDDERLRVIARHAITADRDFVSRYVSSSGTTTSQAADVAGLWLAPFLALFIYESAKKRSFAFPELADEPLPPDVADVVARSRHALKLFSDRKRGVAGQIRYYWERVVDVHRDRFIGGVRVGFLRWLGRDLGVFEYDGRPIGTTHAAAFFMGLSSEVLLDRRAGANRRAVQSLAISYGKYMGGLGAVLSPDARSFLDGMDDQLLVLDKDVRASSYYNTVFNGARTPALNSLLCVFQCLVNLVLELGRCDRDPRSMQTVVKLQYLVGFEVARSVRELAKHTTLELTRSSHDAVEAILEAVDGGAVFAESATPLRNSLMHYDMDSRIPECAWRPDVAFYGLPAAVLRCRAEEFRERVVVTLEAMAGQLNSWSG